MWKMGRGSVGDVVLKQGFFPPSPINVLFFELTWEVGIRLSRLLTFLASLPKYPQQISA